MNDRLLNWIKPQVDFDWKEYWNEKDRFSSFDQGPLAVSYYQRDQKGLLTGLFDELIEEIPAAGRVLDVGCGNGAGSAALLAAADQVQKSINVDMLDLAGICPPQSLLERVKITTGDVERMPFPDHTFDLVLSCFCAEFCDILQVVKECHKVLKRGGRLAMFVYARESPLVSRQSHYVKIYRNGLKQLLDDIVAGRTASRELIQDIRSRIVADDPPPYFHAHLDAIIDHLERLTGRGLSEPVDVDARLLPDGDHLPNVFSVRALQRKLALWAAIDIIALDFHDGFELQRRVQNTRFDDSYIVPAEFNSALIGYFQAGEKPC